MDRQANSWLERVERFQPVNGCVKDRSVSISPADEALAMLLPLAESHSMLTIVPYKLAVCACALGRIEESRMFLSKAIEAGGDPIKLRALDDPELGPLWTAE